MCYHPRGNNNTNTMMMMSSSSSSSSSSSGSRSSSSSRSRSSSSIIAVDDKDRVQNKAIVTFSTLTVREYPRCIGYDTVTSVGGPPISMERCHQSEILYKSIDEYEAIHHNISNKKSRFLLELKLPCKQRDDILCKHGYSLAERQYATKQSTITRNQRKKSNNRRIRYSRFNSIKKMLSSNEKKVSPA
jgi:hypothetical protein